MGRRATLAQVCNSFCLGVAAVSGNAHRRFYGCMLLKIWSPCLRMVVAGGSPWTRPAYPGEWGPFALPSLFEVESSKIIMKIMEAVRLKIQTQKKVEGPKITQPVENMHVRHVDSTVEVEEPKVINETVRPTTQTKRRLRFPRSHGKSRTRMPSVTPTQWKWRGPGGPKSIRRRLGGPKITQQAESTHVQHDDASTVETEKAKKT